MRRRRSDSTTLSDDDISVSSDQLLRKFIQKQTPPPQLHLTPPKFNLGQLSDNRSWHPTPKRSQPAAATQRKHTQLVIPAGKAKLSRPQGLPSHVTFAAPKHVVVCVRRKQRKQVLFAKKLTGRGSRARKHQRNIWSSIKC